MHVTPTAAAAAILLSISGATVALAGTPGRSVSPALVASSVHSATYTAMKRKRSKRSKYSRPPGTSGGPPVSTPGAPAGSGTGNGATGSGAAPSGQ